MRASLAFAVTGLAAAIAAGLLLVFSNAYSGSECAAEIDGAAVCHSSGRTLLEENGSGVLAWLALPTLLATILLALSLTGARFARAASWVVVVGLCAFCLLTGFSIGLFYFPAAVLCLLSVLRHRPVRTTAQ